MAKQAAVVLWLVLLGTIMFVSGQQQQQEPARATTVQSNTAYLGWDVKRVMDRFETELLEHSEQPQAVVQKVMPSLVIVAVRGGDRGSLSPVLAERTLVMRRARLNTTAALEHVFNNMQKIASDEALSLKQGAASIFGHRIFVLLRSLLLAAGVLGHDVLVDTTQATVVQCLVTHTPNEELSLEAAAQIVAQALQQKAGSVEALYELLGSSDFLVAVQRNLVAVFGGENAVEIPREELFPRAKISRPSAAELERSGAKSKLSDDELLDILKREGQIPQDFKLGERKQRKEV